MHLTQFLFYNLIEVLCRPKWQNQETPSHFAADWWLLTVIVVSHSLNCTITEFQLRPQLCRAAVPLTCFFFSLCMRFFSANAPNVSSEVFTGLTFLHGTGPFFISGNVTKTQNDFHKDARGAVTCRKRWKRFGWLEELTLTWGYRHKQTNKQHPVSKDVNVRDRKWKLSMGIYGNKLKKSGIYCIIFKNVH